VLAGAAAAAAAASCRPAAAETGAAAGPARSVCRICTVACGIDVWVEAGRVVRVNGARESATRGFVCANGLALPELQASPRRVTRPMVRRGGRLRPVSWDEALRAAAGGIQEVSRRHGPRAVAFQTGWALVYRNMIGWIRRLADAVGTPNYASSSSICVAASRLSSQLTFGRIGSADFNRSERCLVWGWNPLYSSPPLANVLLRRQREGARLVVVDPCRTRLAAQADVHLQLRAGSDLALALGLLGVVVRERLYDEAAVRARTVGLDELAAAVAPLDAAWAAARTGLEPAAIEGLARDLARAASATGHTGVAVEQSTSGVQTCRAVHALWALTGNVGREGGWRLLPRLGTEAVEAARALEPRPAPVTERAVGAAEHPLFEELVDEAQGNLFPRAVLEDDPYAVRALVVIGANPALSSPDSQELRRAVERLDLLVVCDPMMTETAELADVVLPVATFLEADDYVAMRNVGEVSAVAPPAGEAWPDWKIVFELARHLGLGRHFPWETGHDARQAQGAAMSRLGRLEGEFPTPSGKIELASERLRRAGQPAVPAPPDVAPPPDRFPLTLTTGARLAGFCNSQVRRVPVVEARVGPLAAELSPATASELGLESGGRARLSTARGAIAVTLRTTADLRPGLVRLPHCLVEMNANELTSTAARDPVSGFAELRAVPCRLDRE
jgi:anaerobic selenocysteine-containing dehydrogenase